MTKTVPLGSALLLAAGLLLASAAQPAGAADATAENAADTQVTYTATTAQLANPERGLYHQKTSCGETLWDPARLRSYRANERVTLVLCLFYLRDFKTSPISEDALWLFDQQAAAVRDAGLKMVLRFAYTDEDEGPEAGVDATVDQVLAHLDQLAPHLRANSDVIAVVQSGFVGTWGEGWYTTHFGNEGNRTTTDWANRKKVVNKLLAVLPGTRMVQLRTPLMKRTMYGTTTVTSSTAYNGSTLSRIGHHNDCFLAKYEDQGTYVDRSVEYPYLQAETKYLPMGGETCQVNAPHSDCPDALKELGQLHWSYLHKDWNPSVLAGWTAGGCMAQVERNLGYRFSLVSSLFPSTVTRGNTFLAQVAVKNTGWSTPYNARPAYLVLRRTSNGAISKIKLTSDPRRWTAGATTLIAQHVGIPSTMATGTYEVLLSLPDPASTLKTRPEYAIQFANSGGVWEPSTGFNRLLTTITIQ